MYSFNLDLLNCKNSEIFGFLQICREVKPGMVFLSYDYYANQVLSEQSILMVRAMIDGLDSEKILWKNMSDVIAQYLK